MTKVYREVEASVGDGKFKTNVAVGPHRLVADELTEDGGADAGPAPHELLLAALVACTSMTIRLYAERKALPLRAVNVKARGTRDDATGLTVELDVTLDGDLDAAQRERVLQIAGKCPVHRTLTRSATISTRLV
ncbi:MAG TPA: OsmC family protein [Polyangiaceae bacterium]|jgi:putative redox protein|nr:OsmC family protein [Polyangiaceae bacterium]